MNQRIYINTSDSKLYKYDTTSSKVYLNSTISNLLRVFGNNVVLNGLEIINLDETEDEFKVSLSSGSAIVDLSLIEYKENSELTIDKNNLLEGDKIIYVISHRRSILAKYNSSRVDAIILNINNKVKVNQFWFSELSKVIIGLHDVKFINGSIYLENFIKDEFDLRYNNIGIEVNDDIYYLRNRDNISKNFLKILEINR